MQRDEGTGKDGEREPLNFTLVIEAPLVEHELFPEWLDSLSPEERDAFEVEARASAQGRSTERR